MLSINCQIISILKGVPPKKTINNLVIELIKIFKVEVQILRYGGAVHRSLSPCSPNAMQSSFGDHLPVV